MAYKSNRDAALVMLFMCRDHKVRIMPANLASHGYIFLLNEGTGAAFDCNVVTLQ